MKLNNICSSIASDYFKKIKFKISNFLSTFFMGVYGKKKEDRFKGKERVYIYKVDICEDGYRSILYEVCVKGEESEKIKNLEKRYPARENGYPIFTKHDKIESSIIKVKKQ